MHELPRDLTSSLRSYRGSIYSGGRRDGASGGDVDLEKGQDETDGQHAGQEKNPTQSSLIIHPTKSNQALNRAYEEQASGHGSQGRQDQVLRFEKRNSAHAPKVNTEVQPAKSQPTTTQTPAKQSIFHDVPLVKDPDPAADRLADDMTPLTSDDFHILMGMRLAPTGIESPKEIAVPNGLFANIHASLQHTQTKYRAFAILVYVLLVLQITISAVFIILGALSNVDTHIVISVLGAVATVIAGALALMQGQGLPNRLRMSRDNLANVVFEAEELYWDMKSGRETLYKDVKKIRVDYLRVIEEMRKNHPDTWNTVSNRLAESSRDDVGRAKKAG